MSYLDLTYQPRERDLLCEFYLEPQEGHSLAEVAEMVAAESSIGTWTDVVTMSTQIAQQLGPKVYRLDETTQHAWITYPLELFELQNIAQLLSSVAGNIFGMSAARHLRLLNIHFPLEYIRSFPGPLLGLSGIRDHFQIRQRPLIGTIIKPKMGLNAREHAQVACEAWIGGCDIVKDDENLTNQSFNPFEERVRLTLAALQRAQDQTGEGKLYLPNVTAETETMLKRTEFVQRNGGPFVMVDILTVGWAAVQTLREHTGKMGLGLHAHRAFHAAFTRLKQHGVSMMVIAKLARLAGVDLLHIGTGVGKMEGAMAQVRDLAQTLRASEHWVALKPVFPVASGGLHPLHIPTLVDNLGIDIVIQAGGGVHGHPQGTRAGAKAMRQAAEAAVQKISLAEYARTHPELARVLEVWG
jgi:ribulose-bisphosphate carboxylase large chain